MVHSSVFLFGPFMLGCAWEKRFVQTQFLSSCSADPTALNVYLFVTSSLFSSVRTLKSTEAFGHKHCLYIKTHVHTALVHCDSRCLSRWYLWGLSLVQVMLIPSTMNGTGWDKWLVFSVGVGVGVLGHSPAWWPVFTFSRQEPPLFYAHTNRTWKRWISKGMETKTSVFSHHFVSHWLYQFFLK